MDNALPHPTAPTAATAPTSATATTPGTPRTLLPVIPSQRAQSGGTAPIAPTAPAAGGVRTLVDDFLAEQASTTAVERFAGAHDDLEAGAAPVQARWYRDLLPATPPAPGQQYAFEVDLDACSGCKACVTACHNLNGLDGDESWRSVGMLTGTGDRPVLQPVTTGCHHCAEPGCLEGCPVDAYVKLDSGVVEHLDDQCIGCTYCTLTCPYEVPQYDADRGIVRKCDLCHDRLAEGEAPACVQACPTEAIRITLVDVEAAGREPWGFDAPAPAATRPTTIFRSSRDLRTDVASSDVHTVRPRHAHPPLVAMLVLTQLAVGGFAGLELLRLRGGIGDGAAATGALLALVVTGVALLASLAHLGRPQYAWRAVLGLRHSWLSREIVAFGAFAPLGALHAAVLGGVLPPLVPAMWTGAAAVATGLGAVAASVMVYVATRREGWGLAAVGTRFGVTTTVLGAGATALAAPLLGAGAAAIATALVVAAAAGAVALALDLAAGFRTPGPDTVRGRTAAVLRGPLAGLVRLRVGAGLLALLQAVAAALLVARGVLGGPTVGLAVGVVLTATLAEACARWWFFAAEGSPRMPGAPR